MRKEYEIDGKRYSFENVELQCGMLYGYCPAVKKWAWLDPNGVQFERERRREAQEVHQTAQFMVPPGCHVWGGEVRNNAAWRKQW